MTRGKFIGRNCIQIIWFSNINYVVPTYELTLECRGQVVKNKNNKKICMFRTLLQSWLCYL